MTFEEWWDKKLWDQVGLGYHFTNTELRWVAEQAWNQAVNEMIKQSEKPVDNQ